MFQWDDNDIDFDDLMVQLDSTEVSGTRHQMKKADTSQVAGISQQATTNSSNQANAKRKLTLGSRPSNPLSIKSQLPSAGTSGNMQTVTPKLENTNAISSAMSMKAGSGRTWTDSVKPVASLQARACSTGQSTGHNSCVVKQTAENSKPQLGPVQTPCGAVSSPKPSSLTITTGSLSVTNHCGITININAAGTPAGLGAKRKSDEYLERVDTKILRSGHDTAGKKPLYFLLFCPLSNYSSHRV